MLNMAEPVTPVILNFLNVEIQLKNKVKYIKKNIFEGVKVELDHIFVKKKPFCCVFILLNA